MDPALLFRGGHALDAVHAGFGAEQVVCAGVIDLEDGRGQAWRRRRDAVVCCVGGQRAGQVEAVAQRRVHVQQGVGKEGGFAAACSRVQFDQAGEAGEGVGRDQGGLQGGAVVTKGGGRGLDVVFREGAEFGICRCVFEEGVELGERLRKEISPCVQSGCVVWVRTFRASSQSFKTVVTVVNSPSFFAVSTSYDSTTRAESFACSAAIDLARLIRRGDMAVSASCEAERLLVLGSRERGYPIANLCFGSAAVLLS